MSDTPAAPKPPQRIEAIDALRGFALIGILLINITAMGGPIGSEYPPGPASLADPNWQVWLGAHLFVFGSMRGLFSILFGASAVLFLRNGAHSSTTFLRRAFWLLLFGVLNGTLLLWPGDILLIYALAAPILVFFVNASLARIFSAAAVIMAVLTLWSTLGGLGGGEAASDAAAALAQERAARLGDYAATLRFMTDVSLEWTLSPGLMWWVLDAAAFMLIGIALFRLNVLTGAARPRLYVWLAVLGFGVGLPLRAVECLAMLTQGDASVWAGATFQISRLAISLGWIGVFMLAWQAPWRRLFAPLSALGKMAFTGYLMQSVIAAFIFSGFGLGLWNALSWPQLWLLALAMMAVLSVVFMLWLTRFRMGPLEWLWRALTFGRAPPLLRERAPRA